MKVTSFAAAAVYGGLSALTVGMGVAGADLAAAAAHPDAAPILLAAHGSPASVLVSAPSPTDISWSWDWDDDDEDWGPTASWDCPAGCSITFEDW
jgi:hypothetical protein